MSSKKKSTTSTITTSAHTALAKSVRMAAYAEAEKLARAALDSVDTLASSQGRAVALNALVVDSGDKYTAQIAGIAGRNVNHVNVSVWANDMVEFFHGEKEAGKLTTEQAKARRRTVGRNCNYWAERIELGLVLKSNNTGGVTLFQWEEKPTETSPVDETPNETEDTAEYSKASQETAVKDAVSESEKAGEKALSVAEKQAFNRGQDAGILLSSETVAEQEALIRELKHQLVYSRKESVYMARLAQNYATGSTASATQLRNLTRGIKAFDKQFDSAFQDAGCSEPVVLKGIVSKLASTPAVETTVNRSKRSNKGVA